MKKGFTLIELLIAITIIGLLIGIATVAYSTAQRKARDGRRKDDLKAVQDGIEQYYGDNAYTYPASCDPGIAYLPGGIPKDPKTGIVYSTTTGWSSCSTSAYCICAALESETNSVKDCAGNNPPTGYNGMTCIRNIQ